MYTRGKVLIDPTGWGGCHSRSSRPLACVSMASSEAFKRRSSKC